MLHLAPRTQQTFELTQLISAEMLSSPSWLYSSCEPVKSLDAADSLSVYLISFNKLISLSNSTNKRESHITRERFRFIEADVTSRFVYSDLMSSRHVSDWQGLLQDTLLVSRSKAIIEGDVTKHLTKSDIMRLPLVDRASITAVGRFLKDELARGRLVAGEVDGREKWWAPSVASIVDWWIHKLAWFCIRLVTMGEGKPELLKVDKSYWVDDLGMPASIFEWATERKWGVVTPTRRHPTGLNRHENVIHLDKF